MTEENFDDVMRLADAWEVEAVPADLAEKTMARIPVAKASENWLDRIAVPVRKFFESRPRRAGMFATAAGLVLVIMVLSPLRYRGASSGEASACRMNQQVIAEALEAYRDQHGEFPKDLESLRPDFLKEIPECPSAGKVTYMQMSQLSADSFRLVCAGKNHRGLPPDHPQSSSSKSP